MALYDYYIAPLSSSRFTIGSYATLLSIISKDCTKEGLFQGLDGGKVCANCRDLRVVKGSSNPAYSLAIWSKAISRCIERRHKETLTQNDLEDAEHFIVQKKVMLKLPAEELLVESRAQIEYFKYMSKLNKRLPNKTYKCIGENAAPGFDTIFGEAAELCKRNPSFRSSLSVALFKAAVVKAKYGKNASLEEKVTNFYPFVRTYGKRAAVALSANLGGPGDRWMRRLDAQQRQPCILDSGEGVTKSEKG